MMYVTLHTALYDVVQLGAVSVEPKDQVAQHCLRLAAN
jgi:hypothetical protein